MQRAKESMDACGDPTHRITISTLRQSPHGLGTADTVLISTGATHKVHSVILCGRSSYWLAAISRDGDSSAESEPGESKSDAPSESSESFTSISKRVPPTADGERHRFEVEWISAAALDIALDYMYTGRVAETARGSLPRDRLGSRRPPFTPSRRPR